MATPETLCLWVRRAEVNGGMRPGVTSDQHDRMLELERENRELRRANEILKAGFIVAGGPYLAGIAFAAVQVVWPVGPLVGSQGSRLLWRRFYGFGWGFGWGSG